MAAVLCHGRRSARQLQRSFATCCRLRAASPKQAGPCDAAPSSTAAFGASPKSVDLGLCARVTTGTDSVPSPQVPHSRPILATPVDTAQLPGWIDRQRTGDNVRLHPSPASGDVIAANDDVISASGDVATSLQTFGRGWKPMHEATVKELPSLYLKLSKSRLTGLVVITAMAGYVAAPGSFDPVAFLAVSAGTGLCSAAANAVNQTMEIPYDAQMARTRSRVLVRAQLSPLHSAMFAMASVTAGTGLLAVGCNPLTGALGLANFFLYTSAYTPLKRLTIWNTWVGSVVGALPPLMGWAACTGTVSSPAAWIMPLVLYSWQFPHFHGLSWARRDDYSRGGYVMTAVTHPAMCRRVALRHCVGLFALGMAVPYAGLTSWWFVCGGAALLNGYFTVLGWQFYRHSNMQSARKLFQFSLVHLIALMGLLVIGAVSKDAKCVGHSAEKSDT